MPETFGFDTALEKAKNVDDTKQLEPNAGRVSAYEVGNNDLDRDTTKHPVFGKLGIKGLPA